MKCIFAINKISICQDAQTISKCSRNLDKILIRNLSWSLLKRSFDPLKLYEKNILFMIKYNKTNKPKTGAILILFFNSKQTQKLNTINSNYLVH